MSKEEKLEYDFDLISLLRNKKFQESTQAERNQALLNMFNKNYDLYQEQMEELQRLQKKNATIPAITIETQPKDSTIKENKRKRTKVRVDCNRLENLALEDLEHFLPTRDEIHFQDKINLMLIHLRSIVDYYDSLLLQAEDDELKEYILQEKDSIIEKMEYISSYHLEGELPLKQGENVQIIYFKYYGQNMFLKDIKNEDVDKYSSYLLLLEAMKQKKFKRVKRIINNNCNLYEVRYNQQRIIFDILDKNVIIIIQGFTKKVKNDKKYLENLTNRLLKYRESKKLIKTMIEDDLPKVLLENIEEDTIIMDFLQQKAKNYKKVGG